MDMAPRCRGKAVEIILTTSFLIIRFKFLDCNVKRASSELLKKKKKSFLILVKDYPKCCNIKLEVKVLLLPPF